MVSLVVAYHTEDYEPWAARQRDIAANGAPKPLTADQRDIAANGAPKPLTAVEALRQAAAEGLMLQPSEGTAGFKGVRFMGGRAPAKPYRASVLSASSEQACSQRRRDASDDVGQLASTISAAVGIVFLARALVVIELG